jgi:uncharacterized protein (DUF362 family)
MQTHVSITDGPHRRDNVKGALDALPETDWDGLDTAETILIKPNLVHHQNQLASTHIDAVRGVLDAVRERTDAKVVIADASYHGTKAAFRNFGYRHLDDEYGNIELFDLNDDEAVPGYYMKRDGTKAELDIFSKTVLDADFTICLAQMKTHRDVGVTLTMKNWTVGIWVPEPRHGSSGKYWPRWPHLHEEGEYAHNETIAELLNQHVPDLAVLDGTVAMEGDGPSRGEPVKLGAALAGPDCVAVDAVGCRLMKINPDDIGYLALANRRGYGTIDAEEIELLSKTAIPELAQAFKKPETWDDHVLGWKEHFEQ